MRQTLRYLGWPLVVGVLCALLVIQRFPTWVGLPSNTVQLKQAPAYISKKQGPVSYADAVENASPAVVNLYTAKGIMNPLTEAKRNDPEYKLYADNLPRQQRMAASLGSGVIMDPNGYLLTNYHVIKDAEQIVVALKDGRETFAEVIGSDPETDLAVLKIDLPNLPSITLAQFDQMRIGDVVMAIGNPYGVGQTVTMGIISATGRHELGVNIYEDFIQTDAAINPGNSGGALIDAHGSLVGINSAIFLRNVGSQGIGFAIPAKLAIDVMESIIEHGHVIRGWLGLEVQALTPALAESFGVSERAGVLVAGVFRGGPAEKAGLQAGDIIVRIDGIASTQGRSAMNQVARMRPGSIITMDILRNGKQEVLKAEIGVRPPANAK